MKITIPEPCDQKWSEMQACGSNRFCNKCEKQIIDFTYYSDAALTKVIKENGGRICGKFTKDQLDRELISSFKKQSFISNFSAHWLGLWLFLTSPFSSIKAQTPIEVTPELKTTKVDTNQFFISGTVVNQNNEPVQDIKVKLVELGLITRSDFNGKFKFVFVNNATANYSLEFNGTAVSKELEGFSPDDTLRINNVQANTSDIKLEILSKKISEIELKGEIIVVEVKSKFSVFRPKTWASRSQKRSRKQ
jgi:hypothetical protein